MSEPMIIIEPCAGAWKQTAWSGFCLCGGRKIKPQAGRDVET